MDVPGTGDRYFVTIEGTLFRRREGKEPVAVVGRVRRRRLEYRITLEDGRRVSMGASRVMRLTYFAEYPAGTRLVRRDGSVRNYGYWNLTPMTAREMGRRYHLRNDQRTVLKIDPKTGEVIAHYPSARRAAAANYMSYQTVLDHVNGRTKGSTCPDGYIYAWDDGPKRGARRTERNPAKDVKAPSMPTKWGYK